MMVPTIILTVLSYFSVYPDNVQAVIVFFNKHPEVYSELRKTLSPGEAKIAMSIVAPELSRYSVYSDKVETGMLKVFYISRGLSDFSIGAFQMKPNFAEKLEREVSGDTMLLRSFSELLIVGNTVREKRYERICRLSSLKWQVKYLSAFIQIAIKKTAGISFASDKERVLYWATLYNGGLHLTPDDVEKHKRLKGFPHFSKRFNYAEVSLEFYEEMIRDDHLSINNKY